VVHASPAPSVELIMLTAFVLLLCLMGAIVPLSRRRAESLPAGWFQISSYRNGMVAHLTPVRDRTHAEDEFGECACNPRSGPYPLDDGRIGVLYVHRAGRRSP
jgi:hypothetical protein